MSDVELDLALGELVDGNLPFDQFARRTWETWFEIALRTCRERGQANDVDDVLQEILFVVWLKSGEWDETRCGLKKWLVWNAKIAAYAQAKKLRRTISTSKKLTRVKLEDRTVPPVQEDRVYVRDLLRLAGDVDRERLEYMLEQGSFEHSVDKLMESSQARKRLEIAHDRPNCLRTLRRSLDRIKGAERHGDN